MTPSTSKTVVHAVIGMVNCYCDMWLNRSHTLRHQTILTPKKMKFKLIDVKQKSFYMVKFLVARNTLSIYPYFNKQF